MMSLRRKLFYFSTLAVVAVLLVLPATGWLARLQWLPWLTPFGTRLNAGWSGDASTTGLYEKVARQAPNDIETQFAVAMYAGDRGGRRLEKLNQRFPQNPMIVATLLRSMVGNDVTMNRADERILFRASQRNLPVQKTKPNDPERVAMFIALAEQGERLEPNNAFFSMMAATGYFAAHQDDAAVAAWLRASKRADFNEYEAEETQAKWKLQRAVNQGAEIGAGARMATAAAVEFPMLGSLRAAARMATVKAVEAELAGNKEQGVALRRATRQNGQTMVLKSKSTIPMLVGVALEQISASRPGGAEVQENNPCTGKDASGCWTRIKRERYKSYLVSIGHSEEAAAYTSALAQGDDAKQIWRDGSGQTYMGFETKTLQLFGGWIVNILLLVGALFSLVFAAIFKLVYRFSPRLQKGEPLQNSARWGVGMGIAFPLLLVGSFFATQIHWEEIQLVGLGIGFLLLIVPPILLRMSLRQLAHGLLVLLMTTTAFGAIIAVGGLAWKMFGGAGQFFEYISNDEMFYGNFLKDYAPWIIGGLVLSVPLSLLGLFGIFSRILRVPFAAGITRGMRAMAVPLAATLVLLWAAAFFYTLDQEHRAIAEQERIVAIGEPQTIAEILHRPYPN